MTIKETYRANIVGHWDFRTGTIKDQSANSNDGVFGGTIGWHNSSGGRVLNFEGSSGYIDIDTIVGDLASDTVGTWVAWIKTDDASTTQEIISFGDTNADTRIQFDIDGAGLLRALAGSAGVTQWAVDTDATQLVNGVWTMVGIVQDGTEPILYVNGTAPAQTFSTSTDKTVWHNDLGGLDNGRIGCGNWNNGGNATFFDGEMREAIIFDTNLTSLEMALLYEESVKEGHYDYTPQRTHLSEEYFESSVTGAWDMNVREGVILDITGGGNNGVISGTGSTQVDGVFGKALQFPGVDNNSGVQIQEDPLIDNVFSGGGALEAWVLATSDGGTSLGRIADKNAWFLLVQSETAGFVKLFFRKGFDGTNGDWKTTDIVMPLNTPVHLIVSYDDSSVANNPTFFINGTEYTVGSGLDEIQTPVGTATNDSALDLWIGSTASNDGIWGGWIDTIKLHNTEFTQAEAQIQYEKGKAKLAYYSEGEEWNVSTGNITSGILENTGWNVSTGTWQVDDSSDGHKQITCVNDGIISIESQQGFGTWEFDWYKKDASTFWLGFMAEDIGAHNAAGQNGYFLEFGQNENVTLFETSAGTPTAIMNTVNSFLSVDTWYRIKVTRNGGVFSVYYSSDNGETYTLFPADYGSNPVTDTTHLALNYVVLIMDQDDAIRNFRFSPVVQ